MDRYSISWSNTMAHNDEGEYVLHKDALQAIATASAEALREAAEGTLVAFERNLDNSGRLTFMLKSLPYNGALGDKFLLILADKQEAKNG